ncbi:MAG TPA: glycosyltransferase family 4 protein [Pirellulales bacterium]|nr:glycosyltransferase family 4 protein [Pirellulales bacterium]
MRIAHIITRMILGGAQENTLLNCEDLLRDYGDEVLLVTGPPLGPEGSLLDRAQARGVPLKIVPSLRRAIHPWRDWTSYRALRKILRDYRPDVVHTHSAKGGLLGRAAATAERVPVVVHGVHGAPFHPYQNPLSRALFRNCERWAAGRCQAFVSVADAMTDLMVASGVAPREKFTTIYSGMEVEPFLAADEHRERVRAELGYRPEHVVIGKIARLFKLKGHADVIAAARKVIARAPQARFLFVGNGILRASLERQIAEAGLSEHFQFAGLVPPERIPEMISAMDVVVHASLREGLARVLPQALIAGKPAVSYDVDGAREVIISGQTGFLVPPGDVNILAEALSLLAEGPELFAQFGAEGRRRFTDQFRHETMTARVRALYERLLRERTPSDEARLIEK